MNIYRVEINARGNICSCELVHSKETESGTVFYVDAANDVDARARARDEYREYNRTRVAERRKILASQGRCRCGRQRDAGGTYCKVCLEGARDHKSRQAARQRGEYVPPPDHRATRAQRREEETEIVRREAISEATGLDVLAIELRLLETIDRMWQLSPSVGKFTAWIKTQIAQRQKGKAA